MATTTLDLAKAANKANVPGTEKSAGFGEFLGGLFSSIMAIAAIAVLILLVWAGIEWITSGGEKSKLESARNKITNAILGMIVLAATTALFMLIQQFLGICIISFPGGSC